MVNNLQLYFSTLQTIPTVQYKPFLVGNFLNIFQVTGLFLYTLKTLEKLSFSDVIKGYRKRPVA